MRQPLVLLQSYLRHEAKTFSKRSRTKTIMSNIKCLFFFNSNFILFTSFFLCSVQSTVGFNFPPWDPSSRFVDFPQFPHLGILHHLPNLNQARSSCQSLQLWLFSSVCLKMGGSENRKAVVVGCLAESIREISGLPECQNVYKRMYGNLVRRVKLLSPLFEELKDSDEPFSDEQLGAFESLRVDLDSAMTLLKSVNQGSKLYQVYDFLVLISTPRFGVLLERVNSVL